jgi:hypothetical protein
MTNGSGAQTSDRDSAMPSAFGKLRHELPISWKLLQKVLVHRDRFYDPSETSRFRVTGCITDGSPRFRRQLETPEQAFPGAIYFDGSVDAVGIV